VGRLHIISVRRPTELSLFCQPSVMSLYKGLQSPASCPTVSAGDVQLQTDTEMSLSSADKWDTDDRSKMVA